jgi:hypothetical protein
LLLRADLIHGVWDLVLVLGLGCGRGLLLLVSIWLGGGCGSRFNLGSGRVLRLLIWFRQGLLLCIWLRHRRRPGGAWQAQCTSLLPCSDACEKHRRRALACVAVLASALLLVVSSGTAAPTAAPKRCSLGGRPCAPRARGRAPAANGARAMAEVVPLLPAALEPALA